MFTHKDYLRIEYKLKDYIALCFFPQPIGDSLWLEDSGSAWLVSAEDYSEKLELIDTGNNEEYGEGHITRNGEYYISLNENNGTEKMLLYDEDGNLVSELYTLAQQFIGNIPSINVDMDLVYYSGSVFDDWKSAFVELSTGTVLNADPAGDLHASARIIPGVGIVSIKRPSGVDTIVLRDFQWQEIWSRVVEPDAEIANSDGVIDIKVNRDASEVVAAIRRTDITGGIIARYDMATGNLITQTQIDTQINTITRYKLSLDYNDNIYVLSNLESGNGEDWLVEVLNPDGTFQRKIGEGQTYSVSGYGTGEIIPAGLKDYRLIQENRMIGFGYIPVGSFPYPSVWFTISLNDFSVNVIESPVRDTLLADSISVPGWEPWYHDEPTFTLVPRPVASEISKSFDSITISWTYDQSPGADIVGFNVWLDGAKENGAQLGLGAASSYQITGLTEETKYLLNVSAVDGSGNESLFSNLLTITTETAPLSPTAEDFEGFSLGALPAGYSVPVDADHGWAVTDGKAKSGTQSLGAATATADNQIAAVEVTVTYASQDDIEFEYYSSSESNYDFFRFYIDGIEEFSQSGESGWLTFLKTMNAGTYTFRFEYDKDGSVSRNDDRAYVDNVDFFSGVIQ